MSEREVQFNFNLSADFNGYVVRHPEILRGVSSDSCIVFSDSAHPGLSGKNILMGEKVAREEKKKCFIAVKTGRRWKVEPIKK